MDLQLITLVSIRFGQLPGITIMVFIVVVCKPGTTSWYAFVAYESF
jgi:hypothetical protein